MLPPTAKNVKTMVDHLQSHGDMSRAEVADLLGISASALKKNMAEGTEHRPMSAPTWQLLLLLADRHPYYRLSDRHGNNSR